MSIPKIGLKQAFRLTKIGREDRLAFFAKGLPLALASARGFWNAAQRLQDSRREADVLINLAKEEAAKILILMDIVRCPAERVEGRIGKMLKWFYSHLARSLYAEAAGWHAVDLVELQKYIDLDRRTHYLDGLLGDYIFPNSPIHRRESLLYVDIAAYEDGVPYLSAPASTDRFFPLMEPPAIRAVEALSTIGAFSMDGLNVVANVWSKVEFAITERTPDTIPQQFADSDRLIQDMFTILIEEGLPQEQVTQEHIDVVYDHWQMPMYDLDFASIPVSLADLEAERETILWSEIGDTPNGY